MRSSSLLLFGVASASLLGARSASAQPGPDRDHPPVVIDRHHAPPPPVDDHRPHPPGDRPPVVVIDRHDPGPVVRNHGTNVIVVHPRQPPPPPRDERPAPRPGSVWIAGRWDLQGDNWNWLPGRYEAERPGQQWRAARWEQQGDQWQLVEGDWVATGGGPPPPPQPQMPPEPPPPPPGPPPAMIDGVGPPHAWRLDRPTVSSYWPNAGRPGTRVVIRGRNFPPDSQVLWGPEPVAAAEVSPDRIVFNVPPQAQSATVLIRRGGNRDLIVGNFAVSDVDAEAEERRIEAERTAAAQAAWNASQARQAADEAARQAALDSEWQQMQTTREQRRAQRVAEIRAKWNAAFLADPDTQAELTLHAQRIAELARAKDVAQVTADAKLGVRIDVATARENDRDQQRLAALQSAFSTRGGAR